MDKKIEQFKDLVRISPRVWPGKELEIQPGDLSLFAPMGIGIEGPLLIRPWDDPIKVLSDPPSKYYGYHPGLNHPFHNVPTNEPSGGIIYFDGTPDESDIKALLRLMEVDTRLKDYAAFIEKAQEPVEERYLVQLRIVSRFALRFMFNALTDEEYESFPEQNLSVGELVWKFIQNQQQMWGTDMGSPNLYGVMGGDGDWAKEELAFGFMVENLYHEVYRIWSRAWLVTK
ncbi:MAG TPA: hypothetical protein VNM22_12110 [Candidatus Limnocylindrales bacterium]|nr:hypothetical protein [Candidatus Limnocylindrales bacterium]